MDLDQTESREKPPALPEIPRAKCPILSRIFQENSMFKRSSLRRQVVAALGLSLVWPFLAGCSDNKQSEAAKTAEQALGVNPDGSSKKTVESKRDVIVEQEKRVIDAQTGEVLSDKKVSTPVTISEEKSVKTDVKVKIGDPKSTGSPR
ncbi:MAG: hypothetical protein NVSMB9_23510 [Isosphaeraceae bacterium]